LARVLPVDVESLRLFLHVLAATVWVGGQLVLGALVPVLRRAGADVPRAAARAFGRVGWTAFAVLVVTGFWNLADYDGTDKAGFAGTISIKLTAVVLSGIAAFVHTRATSRLWVAVGGAAALGFALVALFLGVVLSQA
jgi:putative copper export protein